MFFISIWLFFNYSATYQFYIAIVVIIVAVYCGPKDITALIKAIKEPNTEAKDDTNAKP